MLLLAPQYHLPILHMVMNLLVHRIPSYLHRYYISLIIILFDCFQLRSQLHRRIRRRCLDFERAGINERKSTSECNDSSAVSVKSNGKVTSVENNFVQIKNDCSCSSSNLPGVGLHLNALATTIEGKEVKNECLAHESQLISTARSIVSSSSLMPDEISPDKFSSQKSMERDLVLYSNEAQAVEDAHQTPKWVVGEEFDHSSPQNKRHA